MTLSDFGAIGRTWGPWAGLVLVVAYLLFWPEKVEKLSALAYTAGAWCVRRWRSRAAGARIQSRLNSACEALAVECPDVVPHPIRLRWLRGGRDEVIPLLDTDGLIVCVHETGDEAADTLGAAAAIVRKGLLPKARPYVSPPVMQAVDKTAIGKLLASVSEPQVLTMFHEALRADGGDGGWQERMWAIDRSGYFTRVLLRELLTFGDRRFGRPPDDEGRQESERFSSFLHRLAVRHPEEQVPLQFTGPTLSVNVVLFTRWETRQDYGLEAHMRRVRLSLAGGIDHIYLVALDARFASDVYTVAHRCYAAKMLIEESRQEFDLSSPTGTADRALIVCARRHPDWRPTPEAEERPPTPAYDPATVREAFRVCVPAVERGDVLVVDVVSEEVTRQVKVGLVVSREDGGRIRHGDILGPDGEYLQSVRQMLECGYLAVVDMGCDLETRVREALKPFPREDILDVRETSDGRVLVLVPSARALGRLLGSDNTNIRLAGELLHLRLEGRVHARVRDA